MPGAGFLGDSLTSEVIHSGNDFNPLKTKLFEAKSRRQPRGASGESAAGRAGPHPVTEVRKLMHAIDEIQTDAAYKYAGGLFENGEAVPFITLRCAVSRSDEFPTFVDRILFMTPR